MGDDITDLRSALNDPRRFIALYGTTPPRADAPEERIARAASRLSERLSGSDVDGIVVYDVQDEAGRTSEPRPFPFLPTLPSRDYGQRLAEITAKPIITYKCAARMSQDEWAAYLDETAARIPADSRFLSLVGRASSASHAGSGGISLLRAFEMAAVHPAKFTLGGVAIPERHGPGRSESHRLIDKANAGCRYFIAQVVYAPDAAVALCRDYARDCEARGIAPRRIILTFTPCGRPETLRFVKWLGIRVPEAVENAILSSPEPLKESIRLCAEGLRRVLDSGMGEKVPLGVNVESVSIKKEEIAASVELLGVLRDVAREYGF